MNPIVRMMKRYIKMPLKKALPLLFISALVLVSISGCTSSSNTTSSSGFGTNLAPDNLAGAINDKYKAENYTVNTPFTMTKQGDKITYHGVVTDGPQVGTPYKRNVTIVLTPNRTVARAVYNDTIKQQQAQRFQKFTSGDTAGNIYWVGYLGTTFSSDPSTPQVRIDLRDPTQYGGASLAGSDLNFEYLSNADLSNHYEILTNQQTPAAK